MQNRLKEKLWAFIAHNHPDLMMSLQQENGITHFLEEKVNGIQPLISKLEEKESPGYLIEKLCMEELTKDLEPSRFNFIRGILEDEFELDFLRMKQTGLLPCEVANLMNESETIFETLGFNVYTELDRKLRNAIVGTIQEYLNCK